MRRHQDCDLGATTAGVAAIVAATLGLGLVVWGFVTANADESSEGAAFAAVLIVAGIVLLLIVGLTWLLRRRDP
jgi:hypothetical protein